MEASGRFFTSANGADWTRGPDRPSAKLDRIAFGNGVFVAAGAITLLSSKDGVNWTDSDPGMSEWIVGLAFGNSRFMALGEEGTITTSTNGADWRVLAQFQARPTGLDFVDGIFVAFSPETIWTSGDGIRWTSAPAGTSQVLQAAAQNQGNYVVVGDSGIILHSIARPVLHSARHLNDGSFEFQLNGISGEDYRVEFSIDLTRWETLSEVRATNAVMILRDTLDRQLQGRFYRAYAR